MKNPRSNPLPLDREIAFCYSSPIYFTNGIWKRRNGEGGKEEKVFLSSERAIGLLRKRASSDGPFSARVIYASKRENIHARAVRESANPGLETARARV